MTFGTILGYFELNHVIMTSTFRSVLLVRSFVNSEKYFLCLFLVSIRTCIDVMIEKV